MWSQGAHHGHHCRLPTQLEFGPSRLQDTPSASLMVHAWLTNMVQHLKFNQRTHMYMYRIEGNFDKCFNLAIRESITKQLKSHNRSVCTTVHVSEYRARPCTYVQERRQEHEYECE